MPLPNLSQVDKLRPEYDLSTNKFHLSSDLMNPQDPEMHAFALGKALSTYVYCALNPRIYDDLVTAGRKCTQPQKTQLGLEREIARPDFIGLLGITEVVEDYGALLFTEMRCGKEAAQTLCEGLGLASIESAKSTIQQFWQAVSARGPSAYRDHLPTIKEAITTLSTADTFSLYRSECTMLPQLARITNCKDYERTLKQKSIQSFILGALQFF